MKRPTKLVIGFAALAVAAGAGGTYAWAGGGDDGDGGASGPGADRARAAALTYLGGGHANAVERDSENGAVWEVEVTKTNGQTVDVRLDGNYEIVVVEGDSEAGDSGS